MLAFTCIFGLDEGSRWCWWWWTRRWRAKRDWSATTTTATATTLICFCPPIQAFKHQDRNIQHTNNLIGYALVWWLYVQYTRKHEWHEYIYYNIYIYIHEYAFASWRTIKRRLDSKFPWEVRIITKCCDRDRVWGCLSCRPARQSFACFFFFFFF